jgi:mono/diheme cytochrome c family protein
MKRTAIFLTGAVAALGICGAAAWSDEASQGHVTFMKDVLPILQANCQGCHRPSGQNMSGMVAPMSLMTYEEVRPWAKAIAKVVAEKKMPPWHASEAQHGVFGNERTLTAEQIAAVDAWVKQNAPRGNPQDAPAPVAFKDGWFIGKPDLELSFPQPFLVQDEVQDLYQNIDVKLTAEQLPSDKWVKAVEFRPGSNAVHHIIAYASSPTAKVVKASGDDESDEQFLRDRVMIGGLAPGTDPGYYPEGYAFPLKKDSTITFAMHYHKEAGPGTAAYDDSVMAIQFADKAPTHEMKITNMAHGAFEVPPNTKDWYVVGARTFEKDIVLVNLFPHMHLRGQWSRYTAFYPDGTSEVLLETPQYDFNWQEYYYYKNPKQIPAGTRIEFEMKYDNSPERGAAAGFNSNVPVHFGGPTTEEMDLGWYTYVNADGSSPHTANGADE